MKQVMAVVGIVLGVVTLGWWGKRQRSKAREKAGDEAKARGRAAWQARRSQQGEGSTTS